MAAFIVQFFIITDNRNVRFDIILCFILQRIPKNRKGRYVHFTFTMILFNILMDCNSQFCYNPLVRPGRRGHIINLAVNQLRPKI